MPIQKSKFSPGDMVKCLDSKRKGIVLNVSEESVDVLLDSTFIGFFHPNKLRRLRRKYVIWDSKFPIMQRYFTGCSTGNTPALFQIADERMFFELLSFFFGGKRVRIVITESKKEPEN